MATKRSWAEFRDHSDHNEEVDDGDDASKIMTPPLLFQSLDSYCDPSSLELNPLTDLRLSSGTVALATQSLDSQYSHLSTQNSFDDVKSSVFANPLQNQFGPSGPTECFLAPVAWMPCLVAPCCEPDNGLHLATQTVSTGFEPATQAAASAKAVATSPETALRVDVLPQCVTNVGLDLSAQNAADVDFDAAAQVVASAETVAMGAQAAPRPCGLQQTATLVQAGPLQQAQNAKAWRNVRRRLRGKKPLVAQADATAKVVPGTQVQANYEEPVSAEVPASPRSPRNSCEAAWQQRLEKRQMAVMIIKASEDYKQRPETVPEPVTPNAFDRTMSKRQWEAAVMKWRRAMRPLDAQRLENAE